MVRRKRSVIEMVEVKRLSKEAELPEKGTRRSAGWDLFAVEDVDIGPGETGLVPTGIAIRMPRGLYAVIVPRSGLSLSGLIVVEGTIDNDYRGELKVIVVNMRKERVRIEKGTKIGQLRFHPYVPVRWKEVDELSPNGTERGDRGFGSTGLKKEVK